jgi:hypothetical protein
MRWRRMGSYIWMILRDIVDSTRAMMMKWIYFATWKYLQQENRIVRSVVSRLIFSPTFRENTRIRFSQTQFLGKAIDTVTPCFWATPWTDTWLIFSITNRYKSSFFMALIPWHSFEKTIFRWWDFGGIYGWHRSL